ncbi:hypothetical protein FHS81_001167 [Pseudochelatococcus contaminans]|uniref:Uncharacterized protein n=1 Tax=Pseudochelatococcus contaminans TaxID=1538103 RepID=A0A7W5Z2X5_9HYPH|nr:hypothetical protein [Pseudochelatococcus contaminans]
MKSALKKSAKQLLGPVWRPLWNAIERNVTHMIDSRVNPLDEAVGKRISHVEQELYARAGTLEGRADGIEAQIDRVAKQIDRIEAQLLRLENGWRHHTPTFVSSVASVVALEHDVSRLREELNARAPLNTAHGQEKP